MPIPRQLLEELDRLEAETGRRPSTGLLLGAGLAVVKTLREADAAKVGGTVN